MKKLSILLLAFLVLFLPGMANLEEEEDYPWRNHEAPFDFRFWNMIDNHQQTRVMPEDQKLQGFLYIDYTGETTEDGLPVAKRADCDEYPDECRVGWVLKGIPIEAELKQKGPRLWLVDPADLPQEPGYGHFQWVGEPGSPHGLEIGDVKQGFLLKRVAPAPFFWLGGQGEGGGGGGHDGGDCGDEGGCDGHDGTDGGCDGHDGGSDGGCDGHDGTDGGTDGGCDGHDGTDGGTDDGCSGHDGTDGGTDDGCDGHDGTDGTDGGCEGHDGGSDGGSGGSGGQGGSGGHGGRLVPEGVDPHMNIVTSWDGSGGGHGGGGGCGDEGGCDGGSGGHDGGDCGDEGGCDGGSASVAGAAPGGLISAADLNQDGQVDIFDLVLMASYLGSQEPGADLTGDGAVTIADLSMVAQSID